MFRGQVSIVDRVFGRGIDFITFDGEISAAGGVLIIQTFLSLEKSEEVQIQGRTARQKTNGQYKLILSAEDLVINFDFDEKKL